MDKRYFVVYVVGGALLIEAVAHGIDVKPHVETQHPAPPIKYETTAVSTTSATVSEVILTDL